MCTRCEAFEAPDSKGLECKQGYELKRVSSLCLCQLRKLDLDWFRKSWLEIEAWEGAIGALWNWVLKNNGNQRWVWVVFGLRREGCDGDGEECRVRKGLTPWAILSRVFAKFYTSSFTE